MFLILEDYCISYVLNLSVMMIGFHDIRTNEGIISNQLKV